MVSAPLSFGRYAGLSAPAILLAGAVLAQTAGPPLDLAQARRAEPQAGQQQDETRAAAAKSAEDTDKKFRDLDRRMNRTMRSVCGRC